MASDSPPATEAARRHVTGYLTVPAYAEFQRWLGRAGALTPTWEAWAQGDRAGAAAAVPEEVVHDLVLMGTPASCADRVHAYAAGGADVVNVVLLPDGGETGSEERVRFLCDLAREVRRRP
jgi:alkanesulfonate monooxygenase SsuD/methylene tetrahydromethanopterin reductase-like flavin-dependent oxidoreductase (luciferase family)